MPAPNDRIPDFDKCDVPSLNLLIRLLNEKFRKISIELGRWNYLDMPNLVIASGRNNNLVIPATSIVRLTGPTAAFSISGIAGGTPGRLVLLINSTTQNMTLTNQSTLSATANQITTQTGSDFVTTGAGSALLLYDGNINQWLIVGSQT